MSLGPHAPFSAPPSGDSDPAMRRWGPAPPPAAPDGPLPSVIVDVGDEHVDVARRLANDDEVAAGWALLDHSPGDASIITRSWSQSRRNRSAVAPSIAPIEFATSEALPESVWMRTNA